MAVRIGVPQSTSFKNAITWRIAGSFNTFVVSFLFTESLQLAGAIAFVEWITKTILYYVHETVWEHHVARSTVKELKSADPTKIQYVSSRIGSIWWLTGLSGAGKTTLGRLLFGHLKSRIGGAVFVDGDVLRAGLNQDLGFDDQSRSENTRRASEVAILLAFQGLDVVVCVIAPFEKDRARARNQSPGAFHEIFVDADLETCMKRDPKGLYKRVKIGELKQFTGVASPYEVPKKPQLRIDTGNFSIEASLQVLMEYVARHSIGSDNKTPVSLEGNVSDRSSSAGLL